jgi:enterochelin esterase-like enzyme
MQLLQQDGTPIRIQVFVLVLAALLTGCLSFRSTQGPMASVTDKLACNNPPDTLIVLLPGAYDRPKDFIDEGFVSLVRREKIYADVQIIDAHWGYYKNQQIVQRLQNEVVKPAKNSGYNYIWFAGISMGGYGTLLYAMNHAGALTGVFLLAPYMGPPELSAAIGDQGGLENWLSDEEDKDRDTSLWRWIQRYLEGEPDMPKAYLGYGVSDRFEQPNGLMAKALPAGHSFVIAGGHDWATWRQLWARFLAAAPLPRIEGAYSCKSG